VCIEEIFSLSEREKWGERESKKERQKKVKEVRSSGLCSKSKMEYIRT
jgi:hypothetical protein